MEGGGTGWNDGQWIEYPDPPDGGEPWYNQWFYNDPPDPERWKEVYWDITVEPQDPTDPGVEVAINWSTVGDPDGTTDGFPETGPGGPPPMADQEEFIERAIIWPGVAGIPGEVEVDPDTGVIHLKNRPEDGTPFIIPDYNPEWISIDIRFADGTTLGEGAFIDGEIWHECVPEPATMSLLALGGLTAVLRKRRKR